jgi:GNAT superfamily N-acetyltransferase
MTRSGDHRMVKVRDAAADDIEALARLWFDGWLDAHAKILPAELARLRTLESFRDRLRSTLPSVRVAGDPGGAPAGLSIVVGDELHQFYVAAHARGTGVAQVLLADALARLRAEGIETAWLACAIGNNRAARFYEKSGWRRVGTVTSHLPTGSGTFPLDVWRYEIPTAS